MKAKRDIFFSDEYEAFRDTMRRFVSKEVTPRIDEWEEQGCYDKAIFKRMGDLGFLGLSYPVEYGGQEADIRMSIVFWEELCRCKALGFPISVAVQTDMASPSLAHVGSKEQKEKYLRGVCSGETLMAVGITESNHGSDVASIETRAVLDGDFYRVNGTKMFITNGTKADVINTAVRTGGPGAGGISLLLIETDTPGFSVGRKLNKMGMLSSDTAELVFEDCLVPKDNLLGEEGKGFYALMAGLERERLAACVLIAIGEKPKHKADRFSIIGMLTSNRNSIFPELSNSGSPPAEPGDYSEEFTLYSATAVQHLLL